MTVIEQLEKSGFQPAEDYYYDSGHHSSVLRRDGICVILDFDLCDSAGESECFDYSKYCEMQNGYMEGSSRVYRFDISGEEDFTEKILNWLDTDPDSLVIDDDGGSFDKAHVDNTPLEKQFEDLFIEAYGYDAVNYLQKEYSLSLGNGKNAFVDYVVETSFGPCAVEENGVHYHHPQLIGEKAYRRQLNKQNILSL